MFFLVDILNLSRATPDDETRDLVQMTEAKEGADEPKSNASQKISASVLQMNFMKRTFNQLEKERRKASKRSAGQVVFPPVLTVHDDPVP